MPRGKMLHTKLKEEAKAVAVVKIAEQIALDKIRKEHLKDLGVDNIEMSAREHLGKILDKIEVSDILNLAGVGTIAFIIQPIIKTSPKIIEQAANVGIIAGESLKGWLNWTGFGWLLNLGATGTTEQPRPTNEAKPLDDTLSWLLSIGVACLIVKFGPEMLKTFNGIVGLAGLLLI